jgi:hypothetical protein
MSEGFVVLKKLEKRIDTKIEGIHPEKDVMHLFDLEKRGYKVEKKGSVDYEVNERWARVPLPRSSTLEREFERDYNGELRAFQSIEPGSMSIYMRVEEEFPTEELALKLEEVIEDQKRHDDKIERFALFRMADNKVDVYALYRK